MISLLITSVIPTAAQSAVVVVTEPEGVNLRGGPGTQYVSLAVIPKGAELPVLGAKFNDAWIPTSYAGMMGFVHEQFVEQRSPPGSPNGGPNPAATRPQPAPASSPTPSPTPLPPVNVLPPLRVLPADGLNLRAGPSTDQRILAVIPKDTRLTPLGRSADGKWYLVSFTGLQGWVDSQYVAAWEERPAEPPSRYAWPVAGRSITTYFGGPSGHLGLDIDQYPVGGNPVMAVADGVVTFAGGDPCCSYGIYAIVDHGGGLTTRYAHMQGVEVRTGETVKQGQTVGRSGNTGRSTGAHLHIEFMVNGAVVDPLAYLGR